MIRLNSIRVFLNEVILAWHNPQNPSMRRPLIMVHPLLPGPHHRGQSLSTSCLEWVTHRTLLKSSCVSQNPPWVSSMPRTTLPLHINQSSSFTAARSISPLPTRHSHWPVPLSPEGDPTSTCGFRTLSTRLKEVVMNDLLILQGLGSIWKSSQGPERISILTTIKFCVGVVWWQWGTKSFYKSSQYGIHIQTVAISTR